MTQTLRVADPADAAALTALVRSAYRGPQSRLGWTTEADLLDDERIDEAGVLGKITAHRGVMLLLADEDGPLACCEVADRGGATAYFGTFAVRPALQANGIGRRLLAAAEAHAVAAWGAARIEMTVIRQRGELIAWYERRGYRHTGEHRPFPYAELINGSALRDDLDFVVLVKDLVPPADGEPPADRESLEDLPR